MRTVPPRQLRVFAEALFAALGLTPRDAATASAVLAYADARGLGTHGTGAIASIYAPRLRSGSIDAKASTTTVSESGATTVLDAGRGLGLVAMSVATDRGIELARRFGIGIVTVRNSSHFGAAGYYAHRAARDGLIAIVMTNCGNQGVVPPLGGTTRMFGTNPIGAAVPGRQETPFVLDMSATVVATGKIAAARRSAESVPAGWLVASDGGDVLDPESYYNGDADVRWLGGTLARGAAKGFGLGLLVELLCGPLAGAGRGPSESVLIHGPSADDDDIGHVALVIDPTFFRGAQEFGNEVDDVLATVRSCPPAPYAAGVHYPGAIEAERALGVNTNGVVVPAHLVEPLLDLATELGVTVPDSVAALVPESLETASTR